MTAEGRRLTRASSAFPHHGMTVSNRALMMLADAPGHRDAEPGVWWPGPDVGEQAQLVAAHLREGETYPALVAGRRRRDAAGC